MLKKLAQKVLRAPFHLVGLDVVRRRSRDAQDQRIFFLHLPKCGGVSVNRAMSRAFGPQKLVDLNPKASWCAAEIQGEDLVAYRTSLLFYFLAMKDVNVVTGHFFWSDEAYSHFSEDWSYVTLLRHPVQRWFSHYFYDRYKSGGYFHIEEDLSTFLHSERAREMGTLYARRLSAPNVTDLDQAVAQAKVNLKKFSVLGVLEDMHTFSKQFHNETGVQLNIPKMNVNPATDKKYEAISNGKYIDEVKHICSHDIDIYNYVNKLIYN